jgi:hypothetical protein
MAAYLKSLDDFLLQGKASGKKYVTGNGTTDGNGYLVVHGLTFRPRIIITYCNYCYFISSDGWFPMNYNYPITATAAGQNTAIYADGFQVQMMANGSNVAQYLSTTWYAWE